MEVFRNIFCIFKPMILYDSDLKPVVTSEYFIFNNIDLKHIYKPPITTFCNT
jgi:hypothetical protein